MGAFVGIARMGMNGIYRLLRSFTRRRNEAVFLSRQANEASYDFAQVAEQFRSVGWQATMHLRKFRAHGGTGDQTAGAGMVAYAGHVLHELALLARCRVAVLDRYDPVVSLLDLDSEAEGSPVVVQMWHAFGAFKKFGYQSVGGPEGHEAATMGAYRIHRNYRWVLCSGEGLRQAYAEAFACPAERVAVFRRPAYRALREAAKQARTEGDAAGGIAPSKAAGCPHLDASGRSSAGRAAGGGATGYKAGGAAGHKAGGAAEHKARVLVAPTLRMNAGSPHPLRDLAERRQALEERTGRAWDWSLHPLEVGDPAPGGTNPQLASANLVVTDYSSIVYDAYLLEKPVLFYVPDHAEYAESPGLNADPVRLCPALCARTEEELAALVESALADPASALAALEPFAAPAFGGADDAPCSLPAFLGIA